MLRRNVLAALTAVCIVAPECVAFAQLAGIPPERGLVVAPLTIVAYAIFGGSRVLYVTPLAATALLSAIAVADLLLVLAGWGSSVFERLPEAALAAVVIAAARGSCQSPRSSPLGGRTAAAQIRGLRIIIVGAEPLNDKGSGRVLRGCIWLPEVDRNMS